MTDISSLRRILLLAMVLLAVGGLLTHISVHNPFIDLDGDGTREAVFTNAAAALFGLVDVFLVTFLFTRRTTASWAYLLNGLLVLYGTVIMGHCGIDKIYSPQTPWHRYILVPTAPDILIAWADFFMGSVLYRLWFTDPPRPAAPAASGG